LRVRHSNSGYIGRGLAPNESKILEDPNEHFDYFYKFIIIGDEQVGKTNFMLRVCKGIF
jgi:GTPase SAR1 family protein